MANTTSPKTTTQDVVVAASRHPRRLNLCKLTMTSQLRSTVSLTAALNGCRSGSEIFAREAC